ncbi:ankyrin repeat domain-protein, partial [Staphylotrichum tortipilum]
MEAPPPNPPFHNAGRDQVNAPNGIANTSNGYGNQFPGATFNAPVVFDSPLYRQVDETTTRGLEKSACLSSLGFPGLGARLHDIAAAYSGTCDWLFSTTQFQEWRDRADLPAHNGVLWIKGKPGAGKSTLMKHALRHCEEVFADHLIVAYFFNARGEDLEKTPRGMLRSIVYQLLNKDDTLYEQFYRIYKQQSTCYKGEWEWQPGQLKDFVRSIINKRQSKPLLLLVDALDECNDGDVQDVVGFLESLSMHAVQHGVTLRICLSSRHYPNVCMRKTLELTVETSEEHERDIATYVAQKLEGHDDDIKAKVREKAGSIFMWVVIVVSLLNQANIDGRLEAMRKVLEEVPAGLEEVFNKLLSKDPTDKAETVRMLQWVLLSQRPLKPEELFFAVLAGTAPEYTGPWDRSKITGHTIQRRITSSSKGLIEARTDTATVQFIHLSINDFLFRNQRLQMLDETLRPDPISASHGQLYDEHSYLKGNMDIGPPLYMFSFHGYQKLVTLILAESGVDVNAQGGRFRNALQAASAGGHAEIVRQLLERGADVNAQGGHFGTALQAASDGGHAEVVRQLLERGADVN